MANSSLPSIEESTSQNHDRLACGLFELHLNAGELFVDDLDHSFNFLGRNRSGATLFPQQIHNVGRKLVTGLD